MTSFPKCGLICQTAEGRKRQQKQRDDYQRELEEKRKLPLICDYKGCVKLATHEVVITEKDEKRSALCCDTHFIKIDPMILTFSNVLVYRIGNRPEQERDILFAGWKNEPRKDGEQG